MRYTGLVPLASRFIKEYVIFVEIPLFHVLNARITFGNIHALDQSVDGVTVIQDDGQPICVVEETCFDPPRGYSRLGKTFVIILTYT